MRSSACTHNAVYILVRGANSCFVFDMLRYDNACPANEQESGKLESLCNHHEKIPGWIVLKRFVPRGAPKEPTVDRWKSFGWECDPRAFDDYDTALQCAKKRNQP